jgi:hypothetical protein
VERKRRFEVVELAEVLQKAVEVGGDEGGEKTPAKEEPYLTYRGSGSTDLRSPIHAIRESGNIHPESLTLRGRR